MRILIIGGAGMLGHKMVQRLGVRHDVFSTIRSDITAVEKYGIHDKAKTLTGIDVTDLDVVEKAIVTVRPDVVINAVGIIKQIPAANDVIRALSINSIFPHRLSLLAESKGFRLICISTDCVFDGKRGFYTEDDIPNAVDLYGQSKRWGEVVSGGKCLTIRTSIIGRELGTKHSLVEWFLGNSGGNVNGYRNAIYSGFPTWELSEITCSILADHPDLTGLYHVSSEPINKFELLTLIRNEFKLDIEITPFDDFCIDRSLDSSEFRKETGFYPKPWPEMIREMAQDKTPYDEWNIQLS
jgi:dTDP-4-dehydrorhamnose reductase